MQPARRLAAEEGAEFSVSHVSYDGDGMLPSR